MSIPSVKTWLVTVLSEGKAVARHEVYAPTKTLARIGFRLDFPQYWGTPIRIGLRRK
jgi:hypothetical protein